MFVESKNVWLPKLFILLYDIHPSCREELVESVIKRYGVCLDKTTIHGLLSKLMCWGLVAHKTIDEAKETDQRDAQAQARNNR